MNEKQLVGLIKLVAGAIKMIENNTALISLKDLGMVQGFLEGMLADIRKNRINK